MIKLLRRGDIRRDVNAVQEGEVPYAEYTQNVQGTKKKTYTERQVYHATVFVKDFSGRI